MYKKMWIQIAVFLLCFKYILEPHHEKTGFCLCKNKGADQLCSNCTADQGLCFRYTASTIPLLLISKSCFQSASVTVQVPLCQTWLETPKTGFLALWLLLYLNIRERNENFKLQIVRIILFTILKTIHIHINTFNSFQI